MMAVNLVIPQTALRNNKGQSILEVVLVLPFLFSFTALLYKMNMASQMAINNTQFARSQLFVLTANSPEYPRLSFRFKEFSGPMTTALEGHARMVLGVADPTAVARQNANDTQSIEPIPQIQKIARLGTSEPGSSAGGEVTKRTDIRIRSTASICTQFNSVPLGRGREDWKPFVVANLRAQRWPFGKDTVCKYE